MGTRPPDFCPACHERRNTLVRGLVIQTRRLTGAIRRRRRCPRCAHRWSRWETDIDPRDLRHVRQALSAR